MQHNILVISSLHSRTGAGVARVSRLITEMGHVVRPLVTAIHTADSAKHEDQDIFHIPTDIVLAQFERNITAWPIHAIKIGFIGDVVTQGQLARRLGAMRTGQYMPMVLNPGFIRSADNTPDILTSIKRDLFPVVDVVTPSVEEAEALTGQSIRGMDDMHKAGEMLIEYGAKAVLIRNGHFRENQTVDMLVTKRAQLIFNTPPLLGASAHNQSGFGGVLASAIAVGMAQAQNFEVCIEQALGHTRRMFISEL